MFGIDDALMLGMGGGAISSALGGLMGGNRQASAQRGGAREYMDYINKGRNEFLAQPEAQRIRARLFDMASNDRGFSPQALQGMRAGVQEDYGKALSDINPAIKEASVMPGAGYAPGRANRTARLLGENLAVRKAEANRNITQANDIQARNNMQYAISALPTFMPGFSSTPMMGPGVFQNANAPDMGLPTALGSIGNSLMSMPQMAYYAGMIK